MNCSFCKKEGTGVVRYVHCETCKDCLPVARMDLHACKLQNAASTISKAVRAYDRKTRSDAIREAEELVQMLKAEAWMP